MHRKPVLVVVCILLTIRTINLFATMQSFVNATDAPAHVQLKDITIIVSSCDKYAEIWPAFFACLFRNWSSLQSTNKSTPLILLTGHKTFSHPRVQTFNTQRNEDWSYNLKRVLKHVKTPYVLYLQEDYLLHQPVNEERLASVIQHMRLCPKIAYCQLNEVPSNHYIKANKQLQKKAPFRGYIKVASRASLQAALWRKDVLYAVLRTGENPWEFEKKCPKEGGKP